MQGILEQILAAIQANTAAINAHGQPASGQPASGALNGTTPMQAAYVAPQADPLATPAQPAPVIPQGVTADQITALIQPHISNDALKAELGVAMRGMGINALPETQPHQFGPLYGAFQAIIAKYTANPAQAVPTSII